MPNILLEFIALRLCCTTIINTSLCLHGIRFAKVTGKSDLGQFLLPGRFLYHLSLCFCVAVVLTISPFRRTDFMYLPYLVVFISFLSAYTLYIGAYSKYFSLFLQFFQKFWNSWKTCFLQQFIVPWGARVHKKEKLPPARQFFFFMWNDKYHLQT